MIKFQNQYVAWVYNLLMILLLIPVFLSGCGAHNSAVNRTENYIYAWPNITYTSSRHILIGIIDKRPYVVSGKVKPTYVGLMRGGFGNPWYMYTESGESLADDLSKAIVSGFKNAGINADYIKLWFDMEQQEINSFLVSKQSQKKVLIRINEWKSDTYARTKFIFDLTVEVYDKNGKVIASVTKKNVNESEEKKSTVSPVDAGRSVLTTLLNDESIMNELK